MPPLPYSDCTSKNPATCRYHGALLRMEAAAVAGDLESYMSARIEVERACRERSKAVWEENRVQPAEMWGKTDEGYRTRVSFLKRTRSIPTPLEVYSLWVTLFEAQGGELRKRTDRCFSPDLSGNRQLTYDNLSWNHWTPTKGGHKIPELFGASSMELLVLPELVDQPLAKPSRENAPGWEWGRNVVRVMYHTSDGGLRVSCNQSSCWTYEDVERYRAGKTVEDLVAAVSHQQNQANRVPPRQKR